MESAKQMIERKGLGFFCLFVYLFGFFSSGKNFELDSKRDILKV